MDELSGKAHTRAGVRLSSLTPAVRMGLSIAVATACTAFRSARWPWPRA